MVTARIDGLKARTFEAAFVCENGNAAHLVSRAEPPVNIGIAVFPDGF